MTAIITGDIHLTDNVRDEYRWALLPWLAEQAVKHRVAAVIILGDLTDKKDRHSAKVVNRFVTGLLALRELCLVLLLKGNHDYVDPTCPFFGFTAGIDNVEYITEPTELHVPLLATKQAQRCCFLPSTDDWQNWPDQEFAASQFIFTHQTFVGAERENGTRSDTGVPAAIFQSSGFKGTAISGDIHVPQRIGPITYAGAPYRIDFGDRFKPRVLLLGDDGKLSNLYFSCPSKHLVDIDGAGEILVDGLTVPEVAIKPGDQVKVRVTLQRSDFPLWPKIQDGVRAMAAKGNWVLFGPELRRADVAHDLTAPISIPTERIEPSQVLRQYGKKHQIDPTVMEVGLAILEETKGA